MKTLFEYLGNFLDARLNSPVGTWQTRTSKTDEDKAALTEHQFLVSRQRQRVTATEEDARARQTCLHHNWVWCRDNYVEQRGLHDWHHNTTMEKRGICALLETKRTRFSNYDGSYIMLRIVIIEKKECPHHSQMKSTHLQNNYLT